MEKVRIVITYKNYFQDFYSRQNEKVQHKIAKTIEIIEYIDVIPEHHLKHLRDGLFEIRVQLGNNIFRIFCFFDGKRFVILLGGFQKKTQKTPKQELSRALKLMKEYYKEKEDKR